jgi:hypothetical protein
LLVVKAFVFSKDVEYNAVGFCTDTKAIQKKGPAMKTRMRTPTTIRAAVR